MKKVLFAVLLISFVSCKKSLVCYQCSTTMSLKNKHSNYFMQGHKSAKFCNRPEMKKYNSQWNYTKSDSMYDQVVSTSCKSELF